MVLHEDDRHVIVEHKTAGRKYTLDQVRHDPQPSCYQIAARQCGLGEVGLRYQILLKTKAPSIQVEHLRRDESDEVDFLRTVVGVLRAVDAKAFYPLREGWKCKSCPVAIECETRREVRP